MSEQKWFVEHANGVTAIVPEREGRMPIMRNRYGEQYYMWAMWPEAMKLGRVTSMCGEARIGARVGEEQA